VKGKCLACDKKGDCLSCRIPGACDKCKRGTYLAARKECKQVRAGFVRLGQVEACLQAAFGGQEEGWGCIYAHPSCALAHAPMPPSCGELEWCRSAVACWALLQLPSSIGHLP